jgi:DNA-binding Lrp family transcriptional regulator
VYRRVRVGEHRGVRRIPLREAADALGVSKDALRQRIRRGTLDSDKGGDGRVYVYLDPSAYGYLDPSAGAARPGAGGVVDELRDRVRYLERQVEEERDARRRADTLLARLMDRIPELEAPTESSSDEPGSPETGAEEAERSEPHPDALGAQEDVKRPWWRRVFGR